MAGDHVIRLLPRSHSQKPARTAWLVRPCIIDSRLSAISAEARRNTSKTPKTSINPVKT